MTDETRRPDAIRQARAEVGRFLAARRGQISPRQAGLPEGLGRRRVPGLRREEVALLAGISVEYYARLERGDVGDVSPQVVESLQHALHLDDVERNHLDALLRTVAGRTPPTTEDAPAITPTLQRLLDLLSPAAAFARNERLDVLAINAQARALYAPALEVDDPNLARFLFTNPRSHDVYSDWEGLADHAVGTLRAELGRHPQDAALQALIAELRAASADFAARWDDHTVRRYRAGSQGFRLPDGTSLDLDYQALDVVGAPGITILVYSAAPGSESARRLEKLIDD